MAEDDFGNPDRQPHLSKGASLTFPDQPNASAQELSVAYSTSREGVRFGYHGLNPNAEYRLQLVFFSEMERVQSISVNGQVIHKKLPLPPGRPIRKSYTLPRVLYKGGTLELAVQPVAGPNAVISKATLYAADREGMTAGSQPAQPGLEDDTVQRLNLGLTRWLRNTDAAAPGSASAPGSTDLAIDWPGENRYSLPIAESWRGWKRLEIVLQPLEPVPEHWDIWVYTKDWDLLWRQVRFIDPQVEDGFIRLSIPIAGDEADACWQPVGHRRPWHCLAPEQIRVLGFKFERQSASPFNTRIQVKSVQLVENSEQSPGLTVRDFILNRSKLAVGESCEASFEVPEFQGNPFDRRDVTVDATISLPGAATESVSGFYKEGFIQQPVSAAGRLVPSGRPRFAVRYCPRVPGTHRMEITVRNGDRQVTIPETVLEVRAAETGYHGFLRNDPKDFRHLSFDDGTAFVGLGVNTRSPTDARHERMVPHNLWQDEGLNFYRRVFPIYRAKGINTAEIWMSSWWLALEWIPDAPGNHGVGYLNQHRSWILDRLVELAEDNGIYLILVINNHGKFSTFCDEEWDRNPFNQANGGYLRDNESYFSDRRARRDFKNMADYMVARWAHSPNIMAWKLFSEINLTGDSQNFYRRSVMVDWHREMAGHIAEQDIYDHLLTTHWSSNYTVINYPIANLPELDILTTDAYTDQFGRTDQMMEYLEGTATYTDSIGKPVVITEFGGHPMGDSLGVLRKQLHLGNWFGFFSKAAVLPMMWWFAIIDEEDFYREYAAISAFMEREDPRGMRHYSQNLHDKGLKLEVLKGDRRMLIWGYDAAYFYSKIESERPSQRTGVKLTIDGLERGDYVVQHWDCSDGTAIHEESLNVGDKGTCTLRIPDFEADFAIKILPVH